MKRLSWWMNAEIPTEKVAFVVLASDKIQPLHNRRTACCREEDLLRWAFLRTKKRSKDWGKRREMRRKYPLALRLTDFDVEREKKQQRLGKQKKPSLSLTRNRTTSKREWRISVIFWLVKLVKLKNATVRRAMRKDVQRSFDDRIFWRPRSFSLKRLTDEFLLITESSYPLIILSNLWKTTDYLETAWLHDMRNRTLGGRLFSHTNLHVMSSCGFQVAKSTKQMCIAPRYIVTTPMQNKKIIDWRGKFSHILNEMCSTHSFILWHVIQILYTCLISIISLLLWIGWNS